MAAILLLGDRLTFQTHDCRNGKYRLHLNYSSLFKLSNILAVLLSASMRILRTSQVVVSSKRMQHSGVVNVQLKEALTCNAH